LLEERENDSWSAGLSAVMGVEWFLRKNLSLLAEYGTLIKYTHNKRTTTFINNDPLRSQITQEEVVSKRFAINDQAVKFGISLYF
jgi:hypothetical protein